MALKTFNIDETVYRKFATFCKANGISMSKRIELFIKSEMENEPDLRPEYIRKLRRIEKEKGIPFKNIKELRKMIEG